MLHSAFQLLYLTLGFLISFTRLFTYNQTPHCMIASAWGSAPSGMLVELHPVYGLIDGLGLAIQGIQACLPVLRPVTQTGYSLSVNIR